MKLIIYYCHYVLFFKITIFFHNTNYPTIKILDEWILLSSLVCVMNVQSYYLIIHTLGLGVFWQLGSSLGMANLFSLGHSPSHELFKEAAVPLNPLQRAIKPGLMGQVIIAQALSGNLHYEIQVYCTLLPGHQRESLSAIRTQQVT